MSNTLNRLVSAAAFIFKIFHLVRRLLQHLMKTTNLKQNTFCIQLLFNKISSLLYIGMQYKVPQLFLIVNLEKLLIYATIAISRLNRIDSAGFFHKRVALTRRPLQFSLRKTVGKNVTNSGYAYITQWF